MTALTREDIAKMGEELLHELVVRPPREPWRFGIRASSGTTGKPLLSVMEYGVDQYSKYDGSRAILVCFGPLNIRLAHALHVAKSASEGEQRILFADGDDLFPELAPLLSEFTPDTIAGFPAFVTRVAALLDEKTAAGVRKLQLAGERITPALEQLLKEKFPNAHIQVNYIANEIGGVAASCAYLPLNSYHPRKGVIVEILDAGEDGVGDIAVSKSLAGGKKIERYVIGDTGRLISGPCRCGAEITLEHHGRKGYDYIKLAGATLRKEEFDRVASLFARFIHDYRAEAGEELIGGVLKGHVTLRVFCKSGEPTAALREEIAGDFSRAVFLTPTQTYADLVEKGLFLPLTVEFSSVPFPQKHKDTKLVRV